MAGGVALVCVLLLPYYPPHQAQAHTTTGDEFLVTDADVRSRSLHCTATGLGLSSGACSIQCTTSPGAGDCSLSQLHPHSFDTQSAALPTPTQPSLRTADRRLRRSTNGWRCTTCKARASETPPHPATSTSMSGSALPMLRDQRLCKTPHQQLTTHHPINCRTLNPAQVTHAAGRSLAELAQVTLLHMQTVSPTPN